jgi:penicillin-binding protein 1A
MPIIKRPDSSKSSRYDREPRWNDSRNDSRNDSGGRDGGGRNGGNGRGGRNDRNGDGRGRSPFARIALWFAGLAAIGVVIGALIVGYALVVMGPNLPSLNALIDYRPKVPLRVYTADHVLIGEFGEERRSLVRFQDIPDQMKKAVLAIEDYRFYDHGGVDFVGILRAGVTDLTHGGASQGASTITMQVARNFFLSSE